jgi:hypothetical protein
LPLHQQERIAVTGFFGTFTASFALATGNLIAFRGYRLLNPPTPRGGTWIVDVYSIDGVILYNMK